MHFFEITSGGRAINGSGYGRPSDHVDPQTTNMTKQTTFNNNTTSNKTRTKEAQTTKNNSQ